MKALKNKQALFTMAVVLIAHALFGQIYYSELYNPDSMAFETYRLSLEPQLKANLYSIASAEADNESLDIQLPLPNGETVQLSTVYAPIMEDELRLKYPEIKSFRVHAKGYTGRIGYTYKGFHGILFTPEGTVYYDVISQNNNVYHCYYRSDYLSHYKGIKKDLICHTESEESSISNQVKIPEAHRGGARSGEQLRTYRLALACTGEYAQYHGGTVTGALSAFVVSMNRVNGIYEREFSITMVLVNNTDNLIYLNANTDPYTNSSGFNMLAQNQQTVNSVIGSSDYDIGHVFSTGGGGIASLGSVCNFSNKARGVTGSNAPTGDPFDVDYVAHEMGHQFGGEHTQNNNCQRSSNSAFEPGSASTIMGYAGICAPNLQNNSDDYFHAHSYDQVIAFSQTGAGNSCASISNTGNSAPNVTVPNGGFHIPIETPFRLDGSATDADGDDLKYCWEQMDLGPSGHPDSPSGNAPIFRSWDPSEDSYRVFPKMVNVIIGNTVLGETYPTYDRDLTFRLTARDYNSAGGGVGFDEIEFKASEDAGPFVVNTPTQGEQIEAGSGYLIEWDVANTDQSPVNCQNVHIELCEYDNGTQKLIVLDTLAFNTPNDGSEVVTFSEINIGGGNYVRVRAADNIFFNINGGTFSITEPQPLDDADITLALEPDYVNGMMALSWNDDFSNETNWYIEKSIGGNQSFSVLDTLGPNSTQYFDFDVVMYGQEYYYRVYAENSVGTSDLSNVVVYEGLGIESHQQATIKLFPNPARETITISSETGNIYSIRLYSLDGAIVRSISLDSQKAQVSLNGIDAGAYILAVSTNDSTSMHRLHHIK